ncbi:MAG TPA: 2-succinyl-5-enolpyruvyl-6-hydroxy-3-cyclohexene-1-carboxylic-acid synthase [Roseiflexaceae bacterium]|nr:2-succinyl-5-enolpyruvyl-6-hydroxy-3-cyclohexene-1-carboxylic-acid synthase [Roseiflexaceae bacterium]
MNTQRANFLVVGALVDGLVRSGVRHFCVCPGSRSTPLALMIARHPQARLWMHLDERSAAFFGLGMAKWLGEPVALVCTSGTAAANFLPAVVEAFHARVPLVVLTADRPHELREVGAPQAIDQVRLFGTHAKWFFDMAEPDESPETARSTTAVAVRAAALARQAPAGPVHLNCPYREPFVPLPDDLALPWEQAGAAVPTVAAGARTCDPALAAALAAELRGLPRGLIVCGPQEDPALPAALARLAEALDYPLLADPLSGLRTGCLPGATPLAAYDAFLRDSALAEQLRPQIVLRFGAMPVSKPLLLYLQRQRGCRMVVADGGAAWPDPALLATDMLAVDGRLLAEAVLAELKTQNAKPQPEGLAWRDAWTRAERAARRVINARLAATEEPFEGKVFAELSELLPEGATLFVGNSMPIRDLDTFFPGGHGVRLLCNRGANGIDGVVSSALGAAAAGARPLVLAIGDISLYHDSNGLLAARQHNLNATIVLLNNDGGGIFSFLPQAADSQHFETLFGTPHGLDFRPLAELYGARYTRAAGWPAFRTALLSAIETPGLKIIELQTDRDRNVTLHREMWRAVEEEVRVNA